MELLGKFFVEFITGIQSWLYLFLIIIAIFLYRAITDALQKQTQSIFVLEREQARGRLTKKIIHLLVVIVVGLGIYVSNDITAQVLSIEPIPTSVTIVQVFTTSYPSPPSPTPTVTLTSTSLPSLTPSPTQPLTSSSVKQKPTLPPPNTITKFVSSEQPTQYIIKSPPNCPNPGIQIIRPGDGASLSGVVQFVGTANIENFDYYKVELRYPNGEWSFLQRYDSPVSQGVIAVWDTNTVLPGRYGFRLIVVDKTGNYPLPCEMSIQIN
ncbi:MAG: hypothetical protein B6242_03495 [Anaerolineaceae bacterium 4572_78]|nr:MAG: hypothetical protein B6242_03495 [Anaerolineaceae bacterium 4572_78]